MPFSLMAHLSVKRLKQEQRETMDYQRLLSAAMHGNVEQTKSMFEHSNIDINQCDENGKTILIKLLEINHPSPNHIEILRLLLQRQDIDINKQDAQGNSALIRLATMEAQTELHSNFASVILEHPICDPYLVDNDGKTALWYAIENDNIRLVELLSKDNRCDMNELHPNTNETPLMYAIRSVSKNSMDLLKLFLDNPKTNIDLRYEENKTILMTASQLDTPDAVCIVKGLLEHGASVTDIEDKQMTALMHASASTSQFAPQIVEILLKHKASLSDCDEEQLTPLMFAIRSESSYVLEIVALLLKHGASVEDRNHEESTPLMLAALSNSPKAPEILDLLLRHGASVTDQDEDGSTPLMCCMLSESQRADEMVSCLLAHGASVNERDNEGKTPLMYAVDSPSSSVLNILDVLFKRGASLSDRDESGFVPFAHALMSDENNAYEIVSLLMEKGASLDQIDSEQFTVLELVGMSRSQSVARVIELLIQNGASVNEQKRTNKATPLISIMSTDNPNTPEIVRALLHHGASLNARDDIGMTPLMHAVFQDWSHALEVVEILLENDASVNDKDSRGMTPLLFAASSCPDSEAKIIKLLLHHNASIVDTDMTGITALMYAAESNSDRAVETVKALLNYAESCYLLQDMAFTHALDNNGLSAFDHFFLNTDYQSTIFKSDNSNFKQMFDLLLPFVSSISLSLAATYLTTDLLDILLNRYPEHVNSSQAEDETLLHCAIQCKSFTKIALIMKYNPKLDVQWKGLTALELAIVYDCKPNILSLISQNMSVVDIKQSIEKCMYDGEELSTFLERFPVLNWLNSFRIPSTEIQSLQDSSQTAAHCCNTEMTWNNLKTKSNFKIRVYPENSCNDMCSVFAIKNCQTLLNTYEKEAEEACNCVLQLLQCISDEFKILAPHMVFQVILSGSTSEGTKCFAPDEMDTICLFVSHSGLLIMFEKRQVLVEDVEGPWHKLCSLNNCLDPRLVAQEFYNFVKSALVSIVNKGQKFGKLCVSKFSLQHMNKISRLKLLWCGDAFPNLGIFVDLVPAFTCTYDLKLPLVVKSKEFFILTKESRHNPDPRDRIRRSYCRAEKDVMNRLPLHIKNGYIIAKALRIASISGHNLDFESLHIADDFNVDEFISSYVLKTCLFNILKKIDSNETEQNVSFSSTCKFVWADNIFEELEESLVKKDLELWYEGTLLYCVYCEVPKPCCRKLDTMLAIVKEIRRWLEEHMGELRD